MRATTRTRQRLGIDYGPEVAIVRRTPQHTVAASKNLWKTLLAVAKSRHEGASDVLRRAALAYVDEYGTEAQKLTARTPDDDE